MDLEQCWWSWSGFSKSLVVWEAVRTRCSFARMRKHDMTSSEQILFDCTVAGAVRAKNSIWFAFYVQAPKFQNT